MKKYFYKSNVITSILILFSLSVCFKGYSQTETIPTGSFIINMGVVPQTVNNSLKPYGLIWNLIKHDKISVKWVINSAKVKDGIDFSYGGVNYRGGTFIIPKRFITAAVQAKINALYPSTIVGTYTTSPLTVNVTYNLKYTPRWTFDFDNGSIAQDYLIAAGIPIAGFPMKTPAQLNSCDDLFAMPHADPVWSTHNNLLTWNKNNKGWIWAACHAVSAMENIYNPADPTQQLNFLSNRFAGFGAKHDPGNTWAANSLVLWGDHKDPNTPFTYAYPTDPEMQFIGGVESGVGANGSERAFMPYNSTSGGTGLGTTWRASTKISVFDNSDPTVNDNIPEYTDGPVSLVAYGRAFGDPTRGTVMYEGGHNHNGTSPGFINAQRIFFNFSFMSAFDKDPLPKPIGPLNVTSGTSNVYTFTLDKPGFNIADYSIEWTSSCGGSFSNKYGVTTNFIPASTITCSPCTITVTVTDACGRSFYEILDITVCPSPPIALDRTTTLINNLPGTGPQPIAEVTPLAGTDPDGLVVSYTLTTLPVSFQGILYYDHDGLPGTPIIAVPVNTVLTPAQMESIKFDPADGFGGNASFNYTVTDNDGYIDETPATYIIPVNPPPVAQDILTTPILSSAGPTLILPPLSATDNGTIINYIISTLPPASQGILYLNGVQVSVGEVITPAQASQLYFDPSGTHVGYAAFTYSATDNNGATDPTPATVTLQIVNIPPVAQDITAPAIANPNGTGQTPIPALIATDADGTVASYTFVSLPLAFEGSLFYFNGASYVGVTGGQVITPAQASSLRFDPVDGFTGTASFTYTATDNDGLVDNSPASYFIPVGIIPPVASNITNPTIYSGAGQTPINPMVGTDPDATNIIVSYTVTSLPAATAGVLYFNNGTGFVPVITGTVLTPAQMASLRFDPADESAGTAVFNYSVTDDEGLPDLSAATFTIPIVNAPPVAVNITNPSLNSTDGPVTLNPLVATDADGSVVNYIITTLPDTLKGVLLLSGVPVFKGQVLTTAQIASLQFDPNHGTSGNAVFYFSAKDDQGATDATPASFTIPINLVQLPPVADNITNAIISINAGATSINPLSASDLDGGTISSFTITSLPPAFQGQFLLSGVPLSAGQVIPSYLANQLYFDPSGVYTGDVVLNYTATDNDGLTDLTPASYTIPVVNQPPVAVDITIPKIKTGTTKNLAPLIGTDSDGTITSYTITTLPNLGTLQVDLTGSGTFSNIIEGQILTPVQATRLRIIAGAVVGTSTFTYTTTDNNFVSDITPATYSIPIASAADFQPPVADDKLNAAINASSSLTLALPLSATDPDGVVSSYTILNVPPTFQGRFYYLNGVILTEITGGGLIITPAQALTIRFDPSGNYIGNVTINYTATDDDGNVDPTPATYIIPIINIPPVATNVNNPALGSNAGPKTINPLIATDADGTIAYYTITSLPLASQGILYLDGTPVLAGQFISLAEAIRLQFDPNPSFSGNAIFTFTATDNLGDVDLTPATYTIPVVNQPPVTDDKLSQIITNQNGTGQQPMPALTGTDEDGNVASFTINTIPIASNGVLYFNGIPVTAGLVIPLAQANLLSFDPADGFGGIASFNYSAKDNSGLVDASPAIFQIPVNRPPTTYNVNSAPMYASGGNSSIPALVGLDDGFIQFYSITILPPVSQGTLYLNGVAVTTLSQVDSLTSTEINQLSFTPSASFTGTTFTYTATDNLGVIDVTPAVYSLPVKILVYGNVWNDFNGNLEQNVSETMINGTNSGAGTKTGAVLYVNLIDINGIVTATTPLLIDGSYIFYNILENEIFIIQLTKNQGIVGQARPATELSNIWVYTGENKHGLGGLPDNTANGEIIVYTSNQSIGSQNFGIQRLPDSDNHSTMISQPVLNQEIILNGNSNPPVLSGMDPEDCTGGCILMNRSVIIDVVPANSELYYNEVLVSNGQRINDFDPSLLKVKITAVTLGSASTSFKYSFLDIADKKDLTPANYTIFWAGSLPVESLILSASLKGTAANLKWETLSESNTSHFEVERSVDKQSFVKTGNNVFAAGNSTSQKQYQLADDITILQSSNIIYYRVKLVDLDGKVTYSNIVAVRLSKKPGITIFPNPFHSYVSVSISTEVETSIEISLIDVSGRLIRKLIQKASKGMNQITINNLDQLPSGVYLIEIIDKKAGTTYQKLLKNN